MSFPIRHSLLSLVCSAQEDLILGCHEPVLSAKYANYVNNLSRARAEYLEQKANVKSLLCVFL